MSRKVNPKVPGNRKVNIISSRLELKKEDSKVKDDQVLDFKKLFWDPAEGLGF